MEHRNSGGGARNRTPVERKGDRELIATRTFDSPPSAVYRAWSQPELFQRWWLPRSLSGVSLAACDIDVRTGGKYRLEFSVGAPDNMVFNGKYLDVVPDARIVWTNDEGPEGAITTVTFEHEGSGTRLTFHETHPSKSALEEAFRGPAAGLPEQLDQLADLLTKSRPTPS